jgi:hypothetical protein
MPKVIQYFRDAYECFSNFFERPIRYAGFTFSTSEHLFQWFKATNDKDREYIRRSPSAKIAKRRGRKIKCRGDWENGKNGDSPYKIIAMIITVYTKFTQHEDLRKILVDTKDAILIEGNWWGDDYWGKILVGNEWEGENWLGKILMAARKIFAENKLFDYGAAAKLAADWEATIE